MARNFVMDGTSISNGGLSWGLYMNVADAAWDTITYLATNGATVATILGRAATVDAAFVAAALNVLCVEVGANDYSGGVQATDEATLETLMVYCDARKAVGFKVYLTTLLPQSTATHVNFNAARAYLNPIMRNAVGTRIDGVIDWAADPIMGTALAGNDTILYSDGIHPTTKGQALLSMVTRKTLNSLVSPTQRKFRLL